MTHKFEHKNKKNLDSEWRRQVLPAGSVLEKLGLTAMDIVADIGCGIGYFTIPAAVIVNINMVYALDTSEEMLADVEVKAKAARVSNIITVRTDEYDLKLPEESVSFALLVNVLHEVDNKQKFLLEIKRILKQNGSIAIVEWKKEDMETGPSVSHRIGTEELKELFDPAVFCLSKETEFGGVFYGLVFSKT
ncbi:MAG: class I SAM-dependent methyltransferase [Eubacteriales bacterium]